MPSIYPSKSTVRGQGCSAFEIGVATDLDKLSKEVDDEGEPIWKSLIMKGRVIYDSTNKKVSVEMDGTEKATSIFSELSRGGRGMELSELIVFNKKLYSVDDRTGIVFDVSDGMAVPWVILATGDGNKPKGFKGEWMTEKDGKLYVGGHGVEFIRNGKVTNRDYQWIKIISEAGDVQHVNWSENYNKLRIASGCPFPGYLTHESCVWSKTHKQWFFLPRKVSKEIYDEKLDETRCGNIMIRCNEDFSGIKIQKIGEVRPSRGYSSFKFIPETNDTVIVAIKSEEIGDAQESFITAFTIDGKILLDDQKLADMKYEGLEFI